MGILVSGTLSSSQWRHGYLEVTCQEALSFCFRRRRPFDTHHTCTANCIVTVAAASFKKMTPQHDNNDNPHATFLSRATCIFRQNRSIFFGSKYSIKITDWTEPTRTDVNTVGSNSLSSYHPLHRLIYLIHWAI
jgi:hypothetical protein